MSDIPSDREILERLNDLDQRDDLVGFNEWEVGFVSGMIDILIKLEKAESMGEPKKADGILSDPRRTKCIEILTEYE